MSTPRHIAMHKIDPRETSLDIQAFIADEFCDVLGNKCQLVVSTSSIKGFDEIGQISSDINSSLTVCCTWPYKSHIQTDAPQLEFELCCQQDNYNILCCGHGLLAAAWYWLNVHKVSELYLTMNGSRIKCYRENEITFLCFGFLESKTISLPDWVDEQLGLSASLAVRLDSAKTDAIPFVSAKYFGGPNSYIVLRVEDGFDLKHLAAPSKALAHYTKRAVIVTNKVVVAPSSISRPSVHSLSGVNPVSVEDDVHFRYFAPQYVSQEDSATGSAMRVVAQFWADEFTTLRARQLSEDGGLFHSRVKGKGVDIGGLCRIT